LKLRIQKAAVQFTDFSKYIKGREIISPSLFLFY